MYPSCTVTLKTPNMRFRGQHLMAFIVHISFKFWPSAAATGHVILASKEYGR